MFNSKYIIISAVFYCFKMLSKYLEELFIHWHPCFLIMGIFSTLFDKFSVRKLNGNKEKSKN